MQFLNWHYSHGVEYYIKSWQSNISWIHHYFSLPLLVSTLFAPWKRLVVIDKRPGFDISRWFETASYNLVSRLIGFLARIVLIFVAILTLIITFLGGFVGLLLWIAIPFMSFPIYQKWRRQPKVFAKSLLEELKSQNDPVNILKKIFGTQAGHFVISHVGVNYAELEENADKSRVSFGEFHVDSFEDIISHLVKSKVWNEEFFNQRQLDPDDFILAANLWDKKTKQETRLISPSLGRPGLARELTYGYTPVLNLYSTDLSLENSSHKLIGREDLIERLERILSSGTNIILSGPPGVGKKTIVLEFARRAITGELGYSMSYKRVLEFDYNTILAKNLDLNSKKSEMQQILAEASAAGNIVLLIKDLHRLTSSEVEGYDFVDMFESLFEKKSLMMIVMETSADYEKYIAPNLRIRKFFEKVEVLPPTKAQTMEILLEAAMDAEDKTKILITLPSLRFMLDESDDMITDLPYPERVLDLLDAVVTYCQQKGKKNVEVSDVARVLSEKTGISFTALTESEKKKLDNIEEIIHKRLIGQDLAI
ncbi:MAG: AAA family ATPase, partial [Patescibacteria group bacterium]|nr:AAA family ATPase [Patescibacteria group bacterium]